MSVTIRMARHGRKKLPFYRIVAADKAMRRDGRHLELLGTLNPLTNPPTVTLKEDRVKYWISVGAMPSQTVAEVIGRKIPGYLDEVLKTRSAKIQKARAARKARTGTGAGKTGAAKKTSEKKAKPAKKAAAKK